MNLSSQDQLALDRGEPVRVTVAGRSCVIISDAAYQRVRQILDYDDSDWTQDEMMLLAAEAAEDLDNMEEIKP